MAWEDLSAGQLCRVLLDPVHNGNRSTAMIEDHFVHDQELVAWAWHPGRHPSGAERTLPPMPREQFSHLVEQWVAAGAPCPD